MTDVLLFGLFALTLAGVARWHEHALRIALVGLAAVATVHVLGGGAPLLPHLRHELPIVANLAGLLLGFAALAAHFEHSHLPQKLTEVLPGGRFGAFLLLVLVGLLSAVLDNIAAALIGASAAVTLFQRRVHVGYLAAIVAVSNAGGAPSPIGDTTTTMLWLAGASPAWLVKAAVGAVVATLFCGWIASGQQHRLQPIVRLDERAPPIDRTRAGIVGLAIAGTVAANVLLDVPALGLWTALLLGAVWRQPDWRAVRGAVPGTCFLLALVLAASLMPVSQLPPPSAWTTLGLGFLSAVFDNIPLTKLAIDQGGHDWGALAFAVGYGGSMLWFGSSAGVAVAGAFPEAKSLGAWLRHGWHVAVGFVLGFAAIAILCGFEARELRKPTPPSGPGIEQGR